jgi:hypothetical protein
MQDQASDSIQAKQSLLTYSSASLPSHCDVKAFGVVFEGEYPPSHTEIRLTNTYKNFTGNDRQLRKHHAHKAPSVDVVDN